MIYCAVPETQELILIIKVVLEVFYILFLKFCRIISCKSGRCLMET